jgi:hypothetical protein
MPTETRELLGTNADVHMHAARNAAARNVACMPDRRETMAQISRIFKNELN